MACFSRTNPQLELVHGITARLVNHAHTIHNILGSSTLQTVFNRLSHNGHDQILPIHIQQVRFKVLPTEPLPALDIERVAPLGLDSFLEKRVFFNRLSFRADLFAALAVKKDFGGFGNVIDVSPKVVDGRKLTELTHVFFPLIGILAAGTSGLVLPQDPF